MTTSRKPKLRCRECGATEGVRVSTSRCESCIYRAEMGESAFERQTALAAAERARMERGNRGTARA